ncbi:MAG TPA: Rossmann-like and DUF2520 domain-containing protein [Gemmatimonadales bacterium]|nr:Rossmann-like and DUF2520 domain-containing protein [Gemmatimonadales bacterium]
MRDRTSTARVGVIGPGRAGTGLALAWVRAGHDVWLHGRRAKPVPIPLTLTTSAADAAPPWVDRVEVIVCAVPDDAIAPLARTLSATGAVRADQVVLHLSGSLDHTALESLHGSGAALGSLHPLQTLVEPERTPQHVRGAWAAVEGDPPAVAMAERLALDIGLHPFRLRPEHKALYHAGAVFASNYFVVVEAVAQQLFERAGLSREDAWAALEPLVRGTFDNLNRTGPEGALTGPVVRGDVDTLTRHLRALPDRDRTLYRELGLAVLELARRHGLAADMVARLERTLATG